MKWRLTEGSSEVILTLAVTNVESEIIDIQVPDTYKFLIAQSGLLDLTLKTAGEAHLTDSAEITIYVARPDKRDQKFMGRFWYREVKNANAYDFC